MSKIRGKFLILALSFPLVAYAVLGGFLGRALARDSAYRYLSVFQDVVTLVMNSYVEPVKMDSVMGGAIRGMMDALDPDSCYLSPSEFADFQKASRGETRMDIGVELTKRYYLQVVAVLPGSPAEQAGLRSDDLLKSIDGVNTRDTNVIVGESLLRGPGGTQARLQVIRGRSPEPIEFSVERKMFPAAPVAYKMLTERGGYVRIASFRPGVAGEVAQAIKTLSAAGASELVVDVRDSFGRVAEEGARVGELLIDGGLAAILQGRDMARTELRLSPKRTIFERPIALLVNRGSSGAAEILASAVLFAKRGELVGEKTSGRSAVQKVIPLADGSGLVLSISQYSTPDGKPLLGNGVEPTVTVDSPDEADEPSGSGAGDPVLEKALEVLKASRTPSKAAA